jgi:hypothetical protein
VKEGRQKEKRKKEVKVGRKEVKEVKVGRKEVKKGSEESEGRKYGRKRRK